MKFSLKNVSVANYKNLTDCNLPIGNITLLVGPNNSGKTNFLEIFELLRNLFLGGELGRKKIAFKLLRLRQKKPSSFSFEYELYRNDNEVEVVKYSIKFAPVDKPMESSIAILEESLLSKLKTVTGKPKTLFSRTDEELTYRDNSNKLKKMKIQKDTPAFDVVKTLHQNNKGLNNYLSYYIPLISITTSSFFSPHEIITRDSETISNYAEELYNLQEQKEEKFLEFKKHFLALLNLKDMTFDNFSLAKSEDIRYYCFIEETNGHFGMIDEMSDGSKILFLMLYKIFIDKGALTCIEEPEVGLHPKALSMLLDIFISKEVPSQIILTTHSPYLLSLVNPENVYIIERTQNGNSEFTPALNIKNLKNRLKSKYVNFGDLFVENFRNDVDTSLD